MSYKTSINEVIKEINRPFVKLSKHDGYFLLTFDDHVRGIFETKSIQLRQISQMSKKEWRHMGRNFSDSVEKMYKGLKKAA